MSGCGWLRRRWHARLRRIDRESLPPYFERLRSQGIDARTILEMQVVHSLLNKHWLCACAEGETLRS